MRPGIVFRPSIVFRLFRSAARTGTKRMVLTVAAIAWGTVAIVVLLSLGEGLRRSMAVGTRGMGQGLAVVWFGETSKTFAGFPPGRPIRLVPEDVDLLLENVPEIDGAAGEMNRWGTPVSRGTTILNRKVTGVHPGFGAIRFQIPEPGGRFLDRLDFEKRRRVVFLGDSLKSQLFGDAEAVGESIRIDGTAYTVIGVMRPKEQHGMYGGPDGNQAVIPISTFQAQFGRRFLNELILHPARPEDMELCWSRMQEVFGGKYRFDPTDDRVFMIWDTQGTQTRNDEMMLGIEIFLGIVGALTLLIGGVGVANIMFATVRQRTAEIGLLMALGARRSWVLGPLVLEALALTLGGGALGLGLGSAVVELLGWVQSHSTEEAWTMMGEPTFSVPLVLMTIGLLGLLGFCSGYLPARRATRIQPATVLRED